MGMKHKISLGRSWYHLHPEIMAWCDNHIGPCAIGGRSVGEPVWDVSIVFGTATYSFRREQDAAAFALRWV